MIDITPTWLAQQGPGPYILTSSNTTYVLDTDVTTEYSFCFWWPNITLDLNGHTVTYGNSTPVSVTNGGFEQGSVRNVPGWSLTNAPHAAIAANSYYLWGNQVLQFTNITAKETIVSSAISGIVANHEYTATVTPSGPWDATVTLSVVDAVTQTVLASSDSPGVDRAMAAVVTFTPTTTDNVYLKIDVTPGSGETETVAIDYVSLAASRDYGVLATYDWYDLVPAYLQTTAIINACGATRLQWF